MKLTRQPDGTWLLLVEAETDDQFIDELENQRLLYVPRMHRTQVPGESYGRTTGAFIDATGTSFHVAQADAGRKFLGALGEIFQLAIREAARRHPPSHAGAEDAWKPEQNGRQT